MRLIKKIIRKKVILSYFIFVIVLISIGLVNGKQTGDLQTPITIDLNISETPMLNESADLCVKIICIYDAPNTTAKITLQDGIELVSGSLTGNWDLKANAPAYLNATIRFTKARDFQIEAVAIHRVDSETSWGDLKVLYLTIGQTKSMLTGGPSYWGSTVQSVPGNATIIENIAQISINASMEEGMPSSQEIPSIDLNKTLDTSDTNSSPLNSPGSLVVTGRFKYWTQLDDYRSTPNTYDWAREMLIEVVRASDGAHLGWGYTNLNGIFSITVENPGSAGFKVINYAYTKYTQAPNSELRIVSNDAGGITGLNYVWRWTTNKAFTAADGTTDIGTWNPAENYQACWLQWDLQRAWRFCWFSNDAHLDTGQGTIVWYPTSTHGTHYHHGGQIHLKGTDARSADTSIHEYGHNVMYNKNGKWMPVTHCPDVHYMFTNEHVNCAWTEGWADFFPLLINGNPIYIWASGASENLETPTWGTPNKDNGPGVEGRVAGALWDIYDSNKDGWDKYSFSFNSIWSATYSQKLSTFKDFWYVWRTKGLSLDAVNCIYQNTINFRPQRIALKALNGQYLCAEGGGGGEVLANRDAIAAWETFNLIDLGGEKVALQASNGQYLCAEGGGGRELVANRNAIAAWETFKLIDLGNNQVALQASNGQYLCAEGGGGLTVVANRNAISSWESFEKIDLSVPPQMALKAYNGQYLCAEGGGGNGVVANRDWISGWETFNLIDRGNGNIALQAYNGQYLCAEGGGGNGVVANRDWISGWESFKLIPI
ncbi:fascin domain-containing protein [Methanothrix sp.]|uniref:fascin domain-containing protein n=2 Tax=Methanothrix sp. TaxID=90426 RepID=UPI003BB610AA